MTENAFEKQELLELLMDEKMGTTFFSVVMKFLDSKDPVLNHLFELFFESLNTVSTSQIGSDCYITVSLRKMSEICFDIASQNDQESVTKKIEKLVKTKNLKMPKIVKDDLYGDLSFINHLANKPITMRNVQELLAFIEEVLVYRL